VEAEVVEPDEALPVAPLDDVLPLAPPLEADVPADTPLVEDDAPVLPTFAVDDPPDPDVVSVAVVVGKAVVEVADWICMESLDWLETVDGGFEVGTHSRETRAIFAPSSE
jgi:hypothetical protein